MKKVLFTLVSLFLLSVASTAYAVEAPSAAGNGPIPGTVIAFPKNGEIPSVSQSTTTSLNGGMGGFGNAESCTMVDAYHRYGARGADVADLQTILNATGAQLPVTGFYGPQTVAAVKAFQAAHGIKVTGAQYRLTTAALNKVSCGTTTTVSTTTTTSTSTTSLLQLGARGAAVTALQQQLNAAGYPVKVTGYFGPKTEYAVGAYQRDHGLKVTGIVGPFTAAGLATGKLPAKTVAAATPTTPAIAATAPQDTTPTVKVGDTDKMMQAAAASTGSHAPGFFSGSTPWILLILAAVFAYLFGPWGKEEKEKEAATTNKA